MKQKYIRLILYVTVLGGYVNNCIALGSNISRFYGNQFSFQVPTTQPAAAIGSIDTTFGLQGLVDVSAIVDHGTVMAIEKLEDETVLVICTKEDGTILILKYNAQGSLVHNYGVAGLVSLPALYTDPISTVIDMQGRLILVGGNHGGWMVRISQDGLGLASLIPDTTWQKITAIALQSDGKIIVAGQKNFYAAIGRYTLDGSLDLSFGPSGNGFFMFDGHDSSVISTTSCMNLVIDRHNNMYGVLVDSTCHTVMMALNVDGKIGRQSLLSAALQGADPAQLFCTMSQLGNIVVAGVVDGLLAVTCCNISGDIVSGWQDWHSIGIMTGLITLKNLIGISNGNSILSGSITQGNQTRMLVISLDSFGLLDTMFNQTGFLQSSLMNQIQGVAVASDGRLYIGGYQVDNNRNLPVYLRLNNSQYVSKILSSPTLMQPGYLNKIFGASSQQLYSGQTILRNGLYGPAMMQKAQAMVELLQHGSLGSFPAGDIVVGLDGYTNRSLQSTMMLSWLKSDGTIDTTVANQGYLNLAVAGLLDEHMSSMVQTKSGQIVIAGHTMDSQGNLDAALLRSYSAAGTSNWIVGSADWLVEQSGYNTLGIGYQQVADRIVWYLGNFHLQGHIYAYSSTGQLDTSWGDGSSGFINSTSYGLHLGPCYNGLTTAVGNLILSYKDYQTSLINCIMLNAAGAAVVTNWGTAASGHGLFAGATDIAADTIRICFDNDQNIVITAVDGAGTSLLVTLLNGQDGIVDTTFATQGILKLPIPSSMALQVTSVQASSDTSIVVTLRDTQHDHNTYVVRLTKQGLLDHRFHSQSNSPGMVKCDFGAQSLTYDYKRVTATLMQSYPGVMQGNLVLAGNVSMTPSDATALVMAVSGHAGSTQISDNQMTVLAGTLDSTIPLGSTGSTNLSGIIPGLPAKLFIYSTHSHGRMVVGSYDAAHCYISSLHTDLTLNSGYGSSGTVTLTGVTNMQDMFVAAPQGATFAAPVYLTGTNQGAMWAACVNSSGGAIQYAQADGGLKSGNIIRRTTNGRVIIAGYNGSSGALVALTSDMSQLDNSFGNGSRSGVYTTGIASPIYAMALDALDRIYIAFINNGSIMIDRLYAHGTAIDTTFNASIAPAQNGYVAEKIRMAIDTIHEQIVLVVQDGVNNQNSLIVYRYNLSDGSSAGSVTVTYPGIVVSCQDVIIDGSANIYLIGMGNMQTMVARIASVDATHLQIDRSYAQNSFVPGIAKVSAGAMTYVAGGALHPHGRIYFIGSNQSNVGYIGALFGDTATEQLAQATPLGQVGVLDYSLHPNYTGGLNLDCLQGWSSVVNGYKAQAITMNQVDADGTSLIAFSNGILMMIGKLDADMIPVSSFGIAGLTGAVEMDNVTSMSQDSSGNLYVTGSSAGKAMVIMFDAAGVEKYRFAQSLPVLMVATKVVQQHSGRYLVAGYDSKNNGLLFGYKHSSAVCSGQLPVDLSFGPAGMFGYFNTGINSPIDDIVLDEFDYSYIVYRINGLMAIVKLTAQGSLVNQYNSPAAHVWPVNPLCTTVNATQPCRLVYSDDGILMVGVTNQTGIVVQAYHSSTGVSTHPAVTVEHGLSDEVVLSQLVATVVSNDGPKFYGSYYTNDGKVGLFGIQQSGLIDSSFIGGVTTMQSQVTLSGLAIQSDGKLLITGFQSDQIVHPILLRCYGYPYLAQSKLSSIVADAGQLDTSFWPTDGVFVYNKTVDSIFNSLITNMGIYRLAASVDGGCIGVASNNLTGSIIFKLRKDYTLDLSWNGTGYTLLTGLCQPQGLFVDQAGTVLVCGNLDMGSWIVQFDKNGQQMVRSSNFLSNLAKISACKQQSMGRLIAAGQQNNGALMGYASTGKLDSSFGIGGIVTLDTSALISDAIIDSSVFYDAIVTVTNNQGSVSITRISPSGLTITPLNGGTTLTGVTTDTNIKVVFDALSLLVVAAGTMTGFVVGSYHNDATGTDNMVKPVILSVGDQNSVWTLRGLYATYDGKIILIGYDAATNSATAGAICVARLISSPGLLELDRTFNQRQTPGYVVSTALVHVAEEMNQIFDGVAMLDSSILLAGSHAGTRSPCFARLYGDLYETQVVQAPSIAVAGAIDQSFGLSGHGINFISAGVGTLSAQSARAIAVHDEQNLLIAVDGGNQISSNSSIMLSMFDVDGKLNKNFGLSGSTVILQGSDDPARGNYQNQYVSDMITFTTTQGVTKAILAGYVHNSLLNSTDSLLVQYITTPTIAGIDKDNFGGFAGSPAGIAFGDGKKANSVAQQSTGRIIVAGLAQNNLGLLVGYTPAGKLDLAFGRGGYQVNNTGSTGLFTHAIDSQDRIVIAYCDDNNNGMVARFLPDGSELDPSFVTPAPLIGSVVDSSQIRIALDTNDSIVVAAGIQNGNSIALAHYSYSGGFALQAGIISGDVLGNANGVYQISKLLVDVQHHVIVIMTDIQTQEIVVCRVGIVGNTYLLDTQFNGSGYARYAPSSDNQVATGGLICLDGRIIVIAGQA